MSGTAVHTDLHWGLTKLWRAIGWDLRLQWRSQIITVSVVISLLYAIALQLIDQPWVAQRVGLAVAFADPATIGFLFVGVLVLFERSASTLAAIVVSPLSTSQYLWSKALSLTLVSVVCSSIVALSVHRSGFSAPLFMLAVAGTSLFLTFLGLAAVVRVPTINAYLLHVPPYLVPLSLPLLSYLDLVHSPLFWLVPTQATLRLMSIAAEGAGSPAEVAVCLAYLAAAVALSAVFAARRFDRFVRSQGG